MRDLPIALTRVDDVRVLPGVHGRAVDRRPAPGNADVISSNIGPEKVFSATVVRMVETPNSFAALATSAALLRSMTASIDFVANAICDWMIDHDQRVVGGAEQKAARGWRGGRHGTVSF